MRNKMNFDDIKAMFVYEKDNTDVNVVSKASQKRHKHIHKPSNKPAVVSGKFHPVTSPADWRRAHYSKSHKGYKS